MNAQDRIALGLGHAVMRIHALEAELERLRAELEELKEEKGDSSS